MSDILDRPYKMIESDLRKKFAKSMDKLGVFFQAIESGSTGVGIPDAFIQLKKKCAWVEFKTVPAKNSSNFVRPEWQEGQIPWALEYKLHGGTWFLVVAVGDKVFYSKESKDSYRKDELTPIANFMNDL